VLLTLLVLATEPILLAIGDFLVVKEDNLQPADMIHVLRGSPERVDYAVQLYQEGYGRKLFISDCSHSTRQQQAIAKGARPEDLAPDHSWSTNTYEEALELKEFLEDNASIQSVIIVSSPYHMRRAKWSHEKVLGDSVRLQFAPVPFEMASHNRRWWTEQSSRRDVLNEYVKLLGYRVRYDFGCFPTGL
jgi:uncharacterized SAM-binding protein YcdF (DUF218 family)